jgi:c-di-GMP-binding flagellar brake protein YcgR
MEDGLESGKGVFAIERRKHERFDVEFPLDYSRIDDKEKYDGLVANASEGGILVYLPERLEMGEMLRIKIFIAKELELNTVNVIAKVVWYDWVARERWGQYRYGLQFQSIYKGDFTKLKDLFREIGKRRNPRQGGKR